MIVTDIKSHSTYKKERNMIKTVLFDLDGTLLRMDQEAFVKLYLGGLSAHMAPFGYDPNAMIKAIWEGTGAMIANNGEQTNEALFWQALRKHLGERVLSDSAKFESFYAEGFERAHAACGVMEGASAVVSRLRERGIQTLLATNPLFPSIATNARISWAGLSKDDFALVTTFENARHCKPNLDYYRDILRELNLDPTECCMVGNDVQEDMIARELGMQVFLLTDCLINREDTDVSQYPHGSISELSAFLEQLT